MRTRILILSVLILSAVSSFAGGDLGGGGSIAKFQKEFQLSPQQKQLLQKQADLDKSFEVWLNNMTPKERQKTFESIFEHIIIPQIVD